jgi:hypothetical protein
MTPWFPSVPTATHAPGAGHDTAARLVEFAPVRAARLTARHFPAVSTSMAPLPFCEPTATQLPGDEQLTAFRLRPVATPATPGARLAVKVLLLAVAGTPASSAAHSTTSDAPQARLMLRMLPQVAVRRAVYGRIGLADVGRRRVRLRISGARYGERRSKDPGRPPTRAG